MDAREATTIHNADLWTRFITDQWSAWLDPFGVLRATRRDDPPSPIAEATAAGVASLLTAFVAEPIERMYESNAPQVTRFVHEVGAEAVQIPPEYARRIPPASPAASPLASETPTPAAQARA